ncbi:hypothetical protein [Romboutsia sp.]|uniref:hypothetical protein n=1 Tax=Romboutsia sp. TaxID=1965302 RepID=UPI003F320B09
MQNLQIKINELESNIIEKDLNKIKKNKLKPISQKDTKDKSEINIKKYNYYVKLSKKIKKYIEECNYYTINIKHDRYNNIVCLVTKFNIAEMEVSMPIDIRVMNGHLKDTYMKCSYYNQGECGLLYIDEFMAGKPGYGYGSLLLSNLKNIIESINANINKCNIKEKCNFKEIKVVKGKSFPYNGIISQGNLNKLYIKHGFDIDCRNNMNMEIK